MTDDPDAMHTVPLPSPDGAYGQKSSAPIPQRATALVVLGDRRRAHAGVRLCRNTATFRQAVSAGSPETGACSAAPQSSPASFTVRVPQAGWSGPSAVTGVLTVDDTAPLGAAALNDVSRIR
jgi:hypothetical protein